MEEKQRNTCNNRKLEEIEHDELVVLVEENNMREAADLLPLLETETETETKTEETLSPSLIDLPLTTTSEAVPHHHDHRRSSSEPADLFEFINFNPRSSSSSSFAEDLFFCGKLLPLNPPPPPPPPPPPLPLHLSPISGGNTIGHFRTRLRSESLRECGAVKAASDRSRHLLLHYYSRSSPPRDPPYFGPSRSLDYRRLRRDRSSSIASTGRNRDYDLGGGGGSESSDRARRSRVAPAKNPSALPWYSLAFGPVRLPLPLPAAHTEMMRRRWRRNNITDNNRRPPPKLLGREIPREPEPDRGNVAAGYNSSGWKLISVLSCKNHGSVSATAPFRVY